MSIRARLTRIENAVTRNGTITMQVTSSDFAHLTDEELARLDSILVRIGKIIEDDGMPVPDECSGDGRAFIAYLLEHEVEYLATLRSLVDERRF